VINRGLMLISLQEDFGLGLRWSFAELV